MKDLYFTFQATLGNRQCALRVPIVFWRVDTRAVAVHQQVFEIQINPDFTAGGGQRNWIGHFAAETDKPATRLAFDTRRLNHALQRPMPAHRNAPHRREFQAATIEPKAIIQFFIPKTIKMRIAFKARVAGRFTRLDAPKKD